MSTITPNRIPAEVEYFADRAQAAADNAADREYERRERVERTVTFDDLAEECVTGLTSGEKQRFMKALAGATHDDLVVMFLIAHGAKERIIARRVIGELRAERVGH